MKNIPHKEYDVIIIGGGATGAGTPAIAQCAD